MEVKSKIEDLSEHLLQYAETRWDLALLEGTEKVSNVLSKLIVLLVTGLMGFFTFFFLSFSAGRWIGEYYNNIPLGYLVVAGIYILITLLIYIFRKNIIQSLIIHTIFKQFQDHDKPHRQP